jgi:hypothetical protein
MRSTLDALAAEFLRHARVRGLRFSIEVARAEVEEHS